MTQKKITTIVGALIALVGLLLPQFGLEMTETQAGEMTTALATIVGLVMTIIGPSVKPPKGSGTALLLSLCCFVSLGGLLGSMVGCQAIKDNPEVSKAVFRIGLRAATYAVVQNNPELQPYLAGIGAVFVSPEDMVSPDNVRGLVNGAIDDLEGLTETDRVLILSITDEALTLYGDIYKANVGKLTENEYREILEAMGQAIIGGAIPSVDAGEGFFMDTPGGLVQIE